MPVTSSTAPPHCQRSSLGRLEPRAVARRSLKLALALVSACLGLGCGDGPGPEPGPLPPWAASNGRGVPAWQAGESPIAPHWEYDADGSPSGQDVGTPADGLYEGGSGTGSEPVTAGDMSVSGGVGAGGFTTGDLNFIVGCDSQQNIDVDGDQFDLSIHLCVDVFINLSTSSLAGYGADQLCGLSPSADTSGEFSSLTVTALPAGCDQSSAVGSCSVTADLAQGLRTRYDYYYYDERDYDENTCALLTNSAQL